LDTGAKNENNHPGKDPSEQRQGAGGQLLGAKDRCQRIPQGMEENGDENALRIPQQIGSSAWYPISQIRINIPNSMSDCNS
jgi:hypothetical protein